MASTFDQANAFQRGLRRFSATAPGSWFFKRVLHHLDLVGHRLAPGRPAVSTVLAGIPVGLLTTSGARSGQPRTVPLLAVPLDDGWGLIASRFGSERPPAWYFNLRADPRATFEVDGVAHPVHAEQLVGPDRERVRRAALAIYPGYAVYEDRAGGRDLGFFVLRPATPVPDAGPDGRADGAAPA
ncbi:nitroreductase/quinone reductase family protein [Intrasporangium sp. YIM S08009]|uniref:nitroreductase/quinone reductase family protein n=1 Tax=Intrasporangium zincisolvens TaxID=3080018 RepID=UPI002B05334D|nr:nitroreductase/quinone reductase family protein [Intrasporangium sp. YIM S08009]